MIYLQIQYSNIPIFQYSPYILHISMIYITKILRKLPTEPPKNSVGKIPSESRCHEFHPPRGGCPAGHPQHLRGTAGGRDNLRGDGKSMGGGIFFLGNSCGKRWKKYGKIWKIWKNQWENMVDEWNIFIYGWNIWWGLNFPEKYEHIHGTYMKIWWISMDFTWFQWTIDGEFTKWWGNDARVFFGFRGFWHGFNMF